MVLAGQLYGAGWMQRHVFGNTLMPAVLVMQVEAGAQVIITQLFYDVEKFIKFCKDCRALGIECPIIPGWLYSNGIHVVVSYEPYLVTLGTQGQHHAVLQVLLHRVWLFACCV